MSAYGNQPGPGRGALTRVRVTPVGVVVIATVVALVVGGLSGFVGARLGSRKPDTSQPAAASPATHAGTARSSPTSSSPTASPTPTRSPTPTASKTSESTNAQTVGVAHKLMPSTVTIRAKSGDNSDIGSGFAIDDHGRIMTNNHVIADAAKGGTITVKLSSGHREKAKLVGRSPGYDLAILRVKNHHKVPGVPFGKSAGTKVGESAVAIGSPLGLRGTVTRGIVSALHRAVPVGSRDNAEKEQSYLDAIQTDASINLGNSGGPLVDSAGNVIGINSAILSGGGGNSDKSSSVGSSGLGFAIPIDQAREIARMLIKKGYATYPELNAKLSDQHSDGGVRVANADSHGAVRHAGVRSGDIITAIDGTRVTSTKKLIVKTRSHRPGDKVVLSYQRDGKRHKAKVRLRSKRG